MKNPFMTIKSILVIIVLFISVCMLVAPVILFLTETGDDVIFYGLGLGIIGLITLILSIGYMKRTNQSFKKSVIENLNKDVYLVEHLHYNMDEWKIFIEKSSAGLLKNLRNILITTIIAGVILILILSGEKKEVFMSVGTVVALMTISISLFFYYQIRKLKATDTTEIKPEVRITQVGVLIGKTRVVSFNNGDGDVEECSSEIHLGMNCICLKIRRLGGRGYIYQWLYLLIPKSRENEISEIINKLNRSLLMNKRLDNPDTFFST